MKYKRTNYCPNCYFPLPYKAKFCAHCGQKSRDSRISIRNLLKDIWFRVLHLESRSLRFMWRLFVPGLVSQEFFDGKQRRYPPPIRFFFVITFIFLFTLSHIVGTGNARVSYGRSTMAIGQRDSTANGPVDFYELARKYAEARKWGDEFDALPDTLKTPAVRLAMDSLMQRMYGDAVVRYTQIVSEVNSLDPGENHSTDSLVIRLGFREIRMATTDVFFLTPEEIIQKYKLTNWLDKMAIRQGVKSIKEPQSLLKAYLGSLAWSVLGLIALLSGLLTLLYWRQNRFYVEHFIFMLNEHTSLFLNLTLAVWANYFFHFPFWVWSIIIAWLVVSPLLAFRRFYGQAWHWTFVKWSLFSIFYIAGFAILFTLGLLIVFFLF